MDSRPGRLLSGGPAFWRLRSAFAAFGQGTSADTCVAVTSTTFRNGAGRIWSSLIYLPANPIYWLVVPWMRRLRLLTLGDFFEERYGSKRMAGVCAVIGTVGMMAILAVGFIAMTKTILASTPKTYEELSTEERAEYAQAEELNRLENADYRALSEPQKALMDELILKHPRGQFSHIDEGVLISVVCVAVMIYAIAGGLEAAFLTDTIQGIFIIFLSFMLIPFSLSKINFLCGNAVLVLDRILELKKQFRGIALKNLGDLVDIVVEVDDYGTQESQLISRAIFEDMVAPRLHDLIGFLKATLA
jgi:SSS family solute:Na+ symporter